MVEGISIFFFFFFIYLAFGRPFWLDLIDINLSEKKYQHIPNISFDCVGDLTTRQRG